MAGTHHRKVEIAKKKARRAIPRPKISRPQGNTAAVRKMLKKSANLGRGSASAS